MRISNYLFFIVIGIMLCTAVGHAGTPVLKLDTKGRGVASMTYGLSNGGRNYLNRNDYLGDLSVRYLLSGSVYAVKLSDFSPKVISNDLQHIKITWQLPGSVELEHHIPQWKQAARRNNRLEGSYPHWRTGRDVVSKRQPGKTYFFERPFFLYLLAALSRTRQCAINDNER